MSIESLNELTKEIEDITGIIKGRKDIIQKCIDRSNFALNIKPETIINADSLLNEILQHNRLNDVNSALDNVNNILEKI